MNAKRALATLAVLTGIGWASPASAAGPSCTISATSVNFGNYNVFTAAPLDSTGTVTYNCNDKAKNITVMLSKGVSGTYSPRTMMKGAEPLSYNLYTDAARSIVWGDGTGGTSVHSSANPPADTNVVLTIYARVPASQDVTAGSFSETISAVINF